MSAAMGLRWERNFLDWPFEAIHVGWMVGWLNGCDFSTMLGRQSSRSDISERHPWQGMATTTSDRVSQRTILGEDMFGIGEGDTQI